MISVSHATLHKRDLSIPRCISGQPQLSPWHYVTPQWHPQDLMAVAGGINEPIPPHVTTLQKKYLQQYKILNCWLFIILTMMMIEDWIVSCACELIVVTVFLSTSLRGDGNMRKLVCTDCRAGVCHYWIFGGITLAILTLTRGSSGSPLKSKFFTTVNLPCSLAFIHELHVWSKI